MEQVITSNDQQVRPSQALDQLPRPSEAAVRVPTYIANNIPSAPEIPASLDELRPDSSAGRAQTVVTTCTWNPVANMAATVSLDVPGRNPSDIMSSDLGHPIPVNDKSRHGSLLNAGNQPRVASR